MHVIMNPEGGNFNKFNRVTIVLKNIYHRQDRLDCVKSLGDKIEQRKLFLLTTQIHSSLEQIDSSSG